MTISWSFPHIPKTANELAKMHWAGRDRERKRWAKIFLAKKRGPWHKMLAKPQKKQRVHLEIRVYRYNIQDPNNVDASCKQLVDALNGHGWLVDDSKRWLEQDAKEEVDRKNKRTTIRMWLLDD